MNNGHGCPGDPEKYQETHIRRRSPRGRNFFGQCDNVAGGGMDAMSSEFFQKVQEQEVCLEVLARLVGKDKESLVEVQCMVKCTDRLRVDGIEQEGSFAELRRGQLQNSFGRET